MVRIEELYSLLRDRNIVFGIEERALNEIAEGKLLGRRVPVARGTAAKAGTAGRIEWFVEFSKVGRPLERKDGSVDHRDLQIDLNVLKGDRIARRIAPIPGIPGTTIFGTPLDPAPVGDVILRAGAGTLTAEHDPECIVAAMDGAVFFDEGCVEVRDRKRVGGDVDYATGSITFNGDLTVTGSVRAGFGVDAKGDVFVEGDVEDAAISSGGSITVKGGALGSGKGRMTCADSCIVRHVSHFSLSAEKDISILEDSVHSIMRAGGSITAKTIVGGSASAYAIDVDVSGSEAEIRTVLDIGSGALLAEEEQRLHREMIALAVTLETEYDRIHAFVRDGMDSSGTLADSDLQKLDLLRRNTVKSVESLRLLRMRFDQIGDARKLRHGDPMVRIGTAYPGTVIRTGRDEIVFTEPKRNIVKRVEGF